MIKFNIGMKLFAILGAITLVVKMLQMAGFAGMPSSVMIGWAGIAESIGFFISVIVATPRK